jgi:Tol biopolymer transport system component
VLLSDFNEDNPSWSPDGLHLVFDVDYSGNRDLYVLDIRDGSTRRLTYHRAPDFDPTWSSDGRWIAFVSDRDGRFNSEIHLITAEAVDDTDTVALTSQASVRYRAPSWSPDSTRLAVTAGAVGLYRDTLQIIALDGQSITDLFSTPQAADRPAWSPDGTRLAFRRRFGIYVSDINTRTLNPLSATLSITYDGFAWLPDGMLVAPLSSYGFALIDPATGMIAQVDTRLYQAPDAMP